MKLLVTGGSGFIGSNFIIYILGTYPEVEVINLDLLTYAGNNENLKEVEMSERYTFVRGDICDYSLVEQLFKEHQFTGVIHFAAESHVDNSIENPQVFIETNVKGTQNLLEVARQFWMEGNGKYNPKFENSRFHHITTDEVYGSLTEEGFFTELTPYAPNSPYSASKAASDMIVRSYNHTYGMNVVTTNCSNNFGPKQHEEKLIPKVITKALSLNKITIYGNGMNVRDWLYVEDHCRAIDLVFREGISGETYLIGGNNERTNIEIVNLICEILDIKLKDFLYENQMKSFKELIEFVQDRAGHDFRYAIDATKIKSTLGWEISSDFRNQLIATIEWYLEKDKGYGGN